MTIVYDLAEPIVAYRVWRVLYHNGTRPRLTSASFSLAWDTKDFTASPCRETATKYSFGSLDVAEECDGPPCSISHGLRPTIALGCGIYAHKALAPALWDLPIGGVIGRVLLAGKVFEYSHGWRAEKARIDGIYGFSAFQSIERYINRDSGRVMSPGLFDVAKDYEVRLIEPTDAERNDLIGEARIYYLHSQINNYLGPPTRPEFKRYYYSANRFGANAGAMSPAAARAAMGISPPKPSKFNPSVT